MITRTIALRGAAVAALALALAGCAPAITTEGTEGAAQVSTSTAAEAVTMTDGWIKAAESGMSAAFGELRNTGTEDVVVTSASTPASTMVELHETVENEAGQLIMREIDGGFTIPAGGALTLEPGGDHIMLMGLTAPIVAGEEVSFALTFSDGSVLDFTAPVKDYSGANENYEGDGEHGDDHSGHGDDHSEHGDDDHSGHDESGH